MEANSIATSPDVEQKCSKCKDVRDTTGYPLWCQKCRTEYAREYGAGKLSRAEVRGFAAGVAAMRDLLAAEFFAQGSGRFEGEEIAALILQAPGPARPGQKESDDSDNG
jgi:hypothetical protein